MNKQFVVSKIEVASDGGSYVHIGFMDPVNKSGEAKPLNTFGPKTMAFSSPEEMMKNLPKAMGNPPGMIGGASGFPDSPVFKLSMREYEDMNIRVGDKVSIEIKKKQDSGI
jgi:hypothetical protein